MPGELFVDVLYRGLELGRRLKLTELSPATGYVEHTTPMPVGAPLELVTDEGVRVVVRVVHIHEQVGGAEHAPGMRVALDTADVAARAWWSERAGASAANGRDVIAAQVEPPAAPTREPEAREPDGRSTLVMSAVDLQAITDQAPAVPVVTTTNGHSAVPLPVNDPVNDGDGDGDGDDSGASGPTSLRGKPGKKKRRR